MREERSGDIRANRSLSLTARASIGHDRRCHRDVLPLITPGGLVGWIAEYSYELLNESKKPKWGRGEGLVARSAGDLRRRWRFLRRLLLWSKETTLCCGRVQHGSRVAVSHIRQDRQQKVQILGGLRSGVGRVLRWRPLGIKASGGS